MVKGGRRTARIFVTTLGVCTVALTVALNVSWILLYWRTGLLLVFGVLLFGAIITGVVLNTIFLVREIRRNEQHDAFINAMTHELKTPVASIRLYLQTLKGRQIDEAKRTEFYDIMLADSDRLTATIEQVLKAGRIASAKQLNRSRVDMAEIVLECLEGARRRHHLPASAITYQERVEGSDRVVLGDMEELKSAVTNLIENAIKYSGAQIQVAVELARAEAGQIRLQVRDSGVGIPRPELKHIFKRFYRIPGAMATRVKGTGLGLFIVRSVAERHGGRAFAESEGAGHGSTFTMKLPVARE